MKILILGDSNVGKTTWVHSLIGVQTEKKNTQGCDVYPYRHKGKSLEFWDTAGNPNLGGLRDCYFIGATCAFIVYKDKSTVDKYKQEILSVLGKKIPFVAFNISEIEDPQAPLRRLFKN